MRSLLRKVVPGLLLVLFLGGSAWAQGRIATVDMRKLFDNYYKTKQARAALDERKADMEKEHGNMVKEWNKAKEDYQALLASANDQAVSPEEREKRKKVAEDKLKQLKESEDTLGSFERSARSTYEEQIRRVHDKVLEEIRGVLEARAKTSGYALVLDTAGETINGTPVILFSNNENDLTQAVLDQLNAAAPVEPAHIEPKQPDKKADKKK